MSIPNGRNRNPPGDTDTPHLTGLPRHDRGDRRSDRHPQQHRPRKIPDDPAASEPSANRPPRHRSPRILNILPIFQPASLPATTDLNAAKLQLAGRLAQLYAMVFADHPEWLDAPVWWSQNPQAMYNDVELFLARVDTERFPIYTEIAYLEEGDLEIVLSSPPIVPQGISFWYEGMEQFDNYKEPIRLIAAIQLREFIEEEESEEIIANDYPNLTIPRDMDLGDLLPILEEMIARNELPEALRGLPDMIRWVQSATDNNWLDISPEELAEMGMEDYWENWDVLTEEWRSAKVIMARINALLDWVYSPTNEEYPSFDPARFAIVWRAIETAYARRSTQKEPQPS